MEKTYDAIVELVNEMKADISKVSDNQNKAAARRVRKYAQEIKHHCGEIRKEVMDEIR